MICLVVAKCSYEEAIEAVKSASCVELRLDLLSLKEEELRNLCSLPSEILVTYRPGVIEASARMKMLKAGIEAGASYVDIEFEADSEYREELAAFARINGAKVLISYHNFERTPEATELRSIIDQCFAYGADIAKIACKVEKMSDNARLLGLLDSDRKLVVTGMGNNGKLSRIVAPLLGSVFTYAAAASGLESAPGQLEKEKLEEILSIISEQLQ